MNNKSKNFFNFSYDDNYVVKGLTKDLNTIYVYEKFLKTKKNILLIANNIYEASILYEKLLNYTNDTLFFPMDDFLTSESLSVSPEFKYERLITLSTLSKKNKKIIVTNLMGFLRFLPPMKTYKKCILSLKQKQELNREEFITNLKRIGYKENVMVNEPGEFSLRGFVIDIYPINYENPVRMELWGDIIENIKYFKIETQLSFKQIEEIEIIPATEFLLRVYKKEFDLNMFSQKDLLSFSNDVVNITDYLEDYITFLYENNQINIEYKNLLQTVHNYKISSRLSNKTAFFHSYDEKMLKNKIYLNENEEVPNLENEVYNSKYITNYNNNYSLLNEDLNYYLKSGKTPIICLHSKEEIERIKTYIKNKNFCITDIDNIKENKINYVVYSLSNGFQFQNYIYICNNDLFSKTLKRYKTNYKMNSRINDINTLKKGDYIVHEQFGIGIYDELVTLQKNGLKKDYIKLIYRDNDVLYIPVEYISRISKYQNKEGYIRLSKLGTKEWENKKQKVNEKIVNLAKELLEVSIQREKNNGFPFEIEDENQIIFEKCFAYNETEDQLKAVQAIKVEMEKKKPMDMLLCGDVGFGKTEVAFRAMFKAVNNGKQVAYLCPTTILSMQQYNNALERFKMFPINIALINRFVPISKQHEILESLKNGKIDIIFGTHRLIATDIDYKDLGLLVVDEEQRFGVTHKEKIKQYKNNIDVLTLSATPIPRTLQLSLSGVRTMCLLKEPPAERYPIQTYLTQENDVLIKEAVYKELARNGQVYIVSNNIYNMEKIHQRFSKLLPNVRIKFAHGRMEKDNIEKIMLDFISNRFDVLISTTIIETGIDIQNVNTLIVLDADKFGLAQLYQLRGRIGRSNKIGYAYLMYQPGKELTEDAQKRLQTIQEFTALGSGIKIAMRDLSIRGAGSVLGKNQSGYIDDIGVDLYLKMLSDAVKEVKGEKINSEVYMNKPVIDVNTYISDDYVSNSELKIEIHNMINKIDSIEKLKDTKKQLEDRFGKINEKMEIYMLSKYFEKLSFEIGIENISQTKEKIEIKVPNELARKIGTENLILILIKISKKLKLNYKNDNFYINLILTDLEKHYIYILIDLFVELKKYK